MISESKPKSKTKKDKDDYEYVYYYYYDYIYPDEFDDFEELPHPLASKEKSANANPKSQSTK